MAVCPEQIVGELTDRVGLFTTVTVAVALTLQVRDTPVTEKVVLTDGLTVTREPLVALKPEDGDHV